MAIVYVKSRIGKSLWEMRIICTKYLYVEKENRGHLCEQQHEGGFKKIVKVGDRVKCPECNRIGHIVWVSKDGKRKGIQCPASHHQAVRPNSQFGALARPRSKSSKNMVFIMDVE